MRFLLPNAHQKSPPGIQPTITTAACQRVGRREIVVPRKRPKSTKIYHLFLIMLSVFDYTSEFLMVLDSSHFFSLLELIPGTFYSAIFHEGTHKTSIYFTDIPNLFYRFTLVSFFNAVYR